MRKYKEWLSKKENHDFMTGLALLFTLFLLFFFMACYSWEIQALRTIVEYIK